MKKTKSNMSLFDEKLMERMREKILLLADPESGYTQEDFDNEFSDPKTYNISLDHDSYKIKFKFKNESNNPNPEYATAGSSGFDLRANLESPITLSPQGGFAIVPTGLYFEIPENYEIQVRSRSGLAAKNQVAVLNSPGTVDADYRGEVKVILINHGLNEFTINHGDRIAQAVIASVIGKNFVKLIKVNNIDENTERGSGGFGSTGVK
jgi:dUTP pyrophosphatase